jgi:hypothetical protein
MYELEQKMLPREAFHSRESEDHDGFVREIQIEFPNELDCDENGSVEHEYLHDTEEE